MEAKRVVKEMNRPQLLPIIGLAPLVAILALGGSITLGLLYSWFAAITVFVAVVVAGRSMNRIDPEFIELFFRSLSLGTEYDPAIQEDLSDFPSVD